MSKKFLTPIQSTVSTGTAPLTIASNTLVTNLNADLLDGQHGSYYAPLSSPTFTGGVSFNDGSNVEGRITAASGAFYIQGGTSSVDTSGLVTIARNSTTNVNISSFNVYADSTTIYGPLYASPIIVGNTGGNVGLSINDGHGNANVFFNHYAGVPDFTGNSGRISVNVDATTGAAMTFSVKSGTTSGTAVALTTPLYLYETYAQFYGTVVAPASTTTLAPLRIPHGTAPTTPTNGDVWTTTTGLFARINGTTEQYAKLASPALTETPTAPTATAGTNTTQIATTAFVQSAVNTTVINTQTASYTLVLGDAGEVVEMNVASANNLTVPLNSAVAYPIGTSIDVVQYGAGQTTIVATGGVTLRSSGSKLKLTGQYSAATLYKRGTDEWVVMGDLSA